MLEFRTHTYFVGLLLILTDITTNNIRNTQFTLLN